MRIGSDSAFPGPLARTQASKNPKDGALIIIDSFESRTQHGQVVESAAASLGPTGTVFRYDTHQAAAGKRATLPHYEALNELLFALATAPTTPDQAREGMTNFIDQAVSGNIENGSSLLELVTAEGFTHSALNLSQGIDSILLLQLLKYAMGDKSKLRPEQKALYRQNLSLAVAPESPEIKDDTKLDNLLLQAVTSRINHSPRIAAAREGWQRRVEDFESGHNSVVLAAGNSGRAQKALTFAGLDTDGSEDTNLFSVPGVTVVGATRENERGATALATESSFGPEVGFLVSGSQGEHFGTSYSSPKVANALRAAHLANPEFSSDQAESWVRQELSDTVQVEKQEVSLLDTRRVSSLLRITE